MNVLLHWFDVSEHLRQQQQPLVMIERPRVGGNARDPHGDLFSVATVGRFGEFWVPEAPLLVPDLKWSITAQGDFVRVPMHAYRTMAMAKGSIMATGVELGMRAIVSLSTKCPKPPAEITLVLGSEVHVVTTEEGNKVYRCYLGVAIRV